MSSLTLPFWARVFAASPQARTDPPRRKSRAPVFVHDAVMPFRGETLLSHMLRQDLARLEAEEGTAQDDPFRR